jgi:hypothetical protein
VTYHESHYGISYAEIMKQSSWISDF